MAQSSSAKQSETSAVREFELPIAPDSASMSPDEQTLAVIIRKADSARQHQQPQFILQTWDFRTQKLLEQTQVSLPPSAKPVSAAQSQVQYTNDGGGIAAYVGGDEISVFKADSLSPLRQIAVPLPPPSLRLANSRVCDLEVAPTGNLVALLICPGGIFDDIRLYDLNTGSLAGEWQHLLVAWRGALSWLPDGSELALAAPQTMPCHEPLVAIPDIEILNVSSGKIISTFATGMVPQTIAFTPDRRIYAVDGNCAGILSNRDPRMKIFDATSGKTITKVEGRGTGVRYTVSASADGRRLVAFVGKVKARWDWGDFVSETYVEDAAFRVWELPSLTPVSTVILPHGAFTMFFTRLKISSHGRYVYCTGGYVQNGLYAIYEIP
ncbi:MAG: hypothetical protein WA638_16460 [Candidatus Acidiferrales bacterium]